MVFRLPSQLETLVPPPYDQRPQPPPWRGSLFVSGMRNSDRSSSQEIAVTAVETDGEKAQQWPPTFYVRVLHDQPVLREFQAWVKGCIPPIPLCTFMPIRMRESNNHAVNQTNFRSLSRVLFDNQTIAIAQWPENTFPGAGMIIYPAQNSSAVLVGALFFEMPFPSFIGGMSPISPMITQSPRHPHFQQRISTNAPYGSSPHHRHAPSLSPHHSDHNSPIEQSIASHRQDPYRYIMPRSGHTPYNIGQPSSSSEVAWSGIKDEDENGYPAFPSQQNPPYT
ncbi:hypothetical protein GALMADRAFT_242855 [Galerina marginata CBS 339.88]|uniref:Uncharacterized protein n=1 Tax=Galerina marginata (strain CBS 339.88) TaxID=685588 RepID=A0A067TBA3_GALM3|nr:hypothetical protein GALMADRAFT_242855 [Galerina marginata CBS 339.88]